MTNMHNKIYDSVIAISIGLALTIIFFATNISSNSRTSLQLTGLWQSSTGSSSISLLIDETGKCELTTTDDEKESQYFFGRCSVDSTKRPAAFQMKNLVGQDFNLYSVMEHIDDDTILLAPFSKSQKTRSMTFKDAIAMVRVQK